MIAVLLSTYIIAHLKCFFKKFFDFRVNNFALGGNKVRKYTFVIIFTLLSVIWIGFIWSRSMQNGIDSGEASGRVYEFVNKIAELLGSEKHISEHFVRKAAHFLEYTILALLICIDIFGFSRLRYDVFHISSFKVFPLSLIVAVLVALTDEFVIQANTEGRGPSIVDVGIDTLGAITGMLCVAAVLAIPMFIKKIKEKQ